MGPGFRPYARTAGGALGFALLAALGVVLELFVVKKKLFASGEYEVGAAIHALENFVLEVHLRVSPFLHSRPGIRPEHSE
jgi:hypothetical protein